MDTAIDRAPAETKAGVRSRAEAVVADGTTMRNVVVGGAIVLFGELVAGAAPPPHPERTQNVKSARLLDHGSGRNGDFNRAYFASQRAGTLRLVSCQL
jgi:hypothetical protein